MINKPLGKRGFFAIALVLAVLSGAALADPPGPARRGPQVFGDWRLDCRDGPCAARVVVRGADGSEVLRLSLPRDAAVVAITTPLAIYLPDGVALQLGDLPERVAPWRTCGPGGCEARVPLDSELFEALRAARAGSVVLSLADGTPVRLPVSLHGSAAAIAARDRISRPAPK